MKIYPPIFVDKPGYNITLSLDRKPMTDTTNQAHKLRKIANKLHDVSYELEGALLPDAQEKLAQDLADKLEEVISAL